MADSEAYGYDVTGTSTSSYDSTQYTYTESNESSAAGGGLYGPRVTLS